MKVFAPRRILPIESSAGQPYRLGLGIPLEGEWVDVDDYFVQATSGNAINDVIHAKVVASEGVPYTCGDLLANNIIYKCVGGKLGGAQYHTVACFIEYTGIEWYWPNYKGKKRILPRRRERKFRSTHGAAIKLQVTSGYGMPKVYITIYLRAPKGDRNGRLAYYSTGRLTVSWNSSNRLTRRAIWSGPSLLAPVGQAIVDGWESAWGVHGESFPGLTETASWCHEQAYDSCMAYIYDLAEYVQEHLSPSSRGLPVTVDSVSTDQVSGLRACFMLNEPEIVHERVDPLLLGKGTATYWRNYLTQHALMSALETFPRLNDNSISNAIEVLGFIKALVVDHKIEIPKSLSQAWLTYRYQYTTSKLDAEEAVRFVRRYSDLGGLDRAISCYGTSSHTFENGTTVICRAECIVVPQIVNTVTRLLRTLDDYGLNPDFYVIWDMIPWSFMVDWFVPIGDMLAVEDANSKFLMGEFYKIMNVCYSLSYTREFENAHVKCYTRWKGEVPTSLNSFYWLEPPSSSSKTTVFRVLDAASIFIGR